MSSALQSYDSKQIPKILDPVFGQPENSELCVMRIAVVTATELEAGPIRAYVSERLYLRSRHMFDVWITGVGTLQATAMLSHMLREERPDLLIQAGVGGGFHPLKHPIGSCVAIGSEVQGDLGVMEHHGSWRTLEDMGLLDPDAFPFQEGRLPNPHIGLLSTAGQPVVKGVTVNRVSTEPDIISMMAHRLQADVESMEGAAFHYICLMENIPFLQLRGISNLVGDRDKSRWQMSAALEAVRDALFMTIDRLDENH
jgi:futalosine hydrolase